MDTAATYLYGEPADVMSLLDISERVVAVQPTDTIVAPLDGERVYLSFALPAPGGSVWISLNVLLATNVGTFLSSSGELTEWEWLKHSSFVQAEWHGISGLGATNVTVREAFYRRRRPRVNYTYAGTADNLHRQRGFLERVKRLCMRREV